MVSMVQLRSSYEIKTRKTFSNNELNPKFNLTGYAKNA